MDSMETVPGLKPGYFLGLLNSVQNPEIYVETWPSPEDNPCVSAAENETSDQNEVLSQPNMRVSVDDVSDTETEAQSSPPVLRSIHEETGECSEMYKQNDENIFSSFNPIDCSEVSSKNSCLLEGEKASPMEQSMRDFCHDKTQQMFKPKIGMTFDSLSEAYQFYNSYSLVMGFSIRKGDNYTNTKKVRTMQELLCQRADYGEESEGLNIVQEYVKSH